MEGPRSGFDAKAQIANRGTLSCSTIASLNIASLNPEDMRTALRQRAYRVAKPHPLNPDLVLIENGGCKFIYTPEGFAERVEKTIDDVVAAIWNGGTDGEH